MVEKTMAKFCTAVVFLFHLAVVGVASTASGIDNMEEPWYDLTIGVITNAASQSRLDSLRRLLTSLENADYSLLETNHPQKTIRLHFSVDSTTIPDVLDFINNFRWPYGPKTISHRIKPAGLIAAVAETWYPSSDNEVGLLLEDDIEVSPLYYNWIYNALMAASPQHDDRIIGVSLYTPRRVEVAKEGKYYIDSSQLIEKITGDPTLPYLHQLPCSWGAVFYANHWRHFHDYMSARIEMDSKKEDATTSRAGIRPANVKPTNSVTFGWKASWKKYMIEMMFMKGLYMLYPNFPDQLSFSTNHLEAGEHIKANDTDHKASDYTVPLVYPGDIPKLAESSPRMDPLQVPSVEELPILDLTNIPYGSLDHLSALRSPSSSYEFVYWSPRTEKLASVPIHAERSSGYKRMYPALRRNSVCKDFSKEINQLVSISSSDGDSSHDVAATLLIATYDRFDTLQMQIEYYSKSPHIEAIMVTWHDVERAAPPPMHVNGIMVEFLPQAIDSLNNRFLPSMKILTGAVIIMDDDMKVHYDDIHLLVETWTRHQNNIVGFYPRKITNETKYNLDGADRWDGSYHLMLTKAMILDKKFLEAYSCSDHMNAVRHEVHLKKNCEDIAMNFLVTSITGSAAPLFVEPLHFIGDFGDSRFAKREGVKGSIHQRNGGKDDDKKKPNHVATRTECYNKFKSLLNFQQGLPEQQYKVQSRLHSTKDPNALKDSVSLELIKLDPNLPSYTRIGDFTSTCGIDNTSDPLNGQNSWHPIAKNTTSTFLTKDSAPEVACDFHNMPRMPDRPIHFSWKNSFVENENRLYTIPDVSNCVLIFGALRNGNLGDVAQSISVSNLLRGIDEKICIWTSSMYYQPNPDTRVGELLTDETTYAGDLHCNKESARLVNRFGAFIIGGGGLLTDRHHPLDCEEFERNLRADLPIAILGVGAENKRIVKEALPLARRSIFVSVRDDSSLQTVQEVASKDVMKKLSVIRDPILSDETLNMDMQRLSKDRTGKPLCLVLPSKNSIKFHQTVAGWIDENDVLINVFEKHSEALRSYYDQFHDVLDPKEFIRLIDGCSAVISSRLHGAIFGLHMGIPTITMSEKLDGKLYNVMKDVIGFEDMFLLSTTNTTREDVLLKVDEISLAYNEFGRGEVVRSKIYEFSKQIHDLLENHKGALFPWLSPDQDLPSSIPAEGAGPDLAGPNHLRAPIVQELKGNTALIQDQSSSQHQRKFGMQDLDLIPTVVDPYTFGWSSRYFMLNWLFVASLCSVFCLRARWKAKRCDKRHVA